MKADKQVTKFWNILHHAYEKIQESNISSFTFFIGFSKLLVCGGYVTAGIDTCEVVDLKSPTKSCKTTCENLPNLPVTLYGAIGGRGLNENSVICGGDQNGTYSKKCFSLENNFWVSLHSMNSARGYAAATQLEDGNVLVTGGWNGSVYLNSAEMLTEEGWESKVPTLPVNIAYHCMVTVNSTTVMVIGGVQNGSISDQPSGKTFYLTLGQESWTEGPELNYKRGFHSCGKLRRDENGQEMSVVVAAGDDGSSYLSSVEILDEGSSKWKTGPELRFGICHSEMVEDQNGGVVLIGGRSPSTTHLDTLFQLPHGGKDAGWKKMEQTLKVGRHAHTAFLVSDNIVDCS